MKAPPPGPPADGGGCSDLGGDPLDRLERLLARQLSLAKRGQLDAMLAGLGQVEQLLAEARTLPRPLSADQSQRLSQVLGLHQQVGLVLANTRHDLAAKLRHSARGRQTLRAYRQSLR